MKLLPIYKWVAGSQTDFTKPFRENEALFKQAQAFWNTLDNSSWLIVSILIFGFVFAILYYRTYNNLPGRHYTPQKWLYFLLGTFCLVLVVTLGAEWLVAKPKLKGAFLLELKIAFCNSLYASGIYFIVSVLWCNIKRLPTNAYRLFKIN